MIRKEKKKKRREREEKKMRDAHTKYQTGRAGGLICFEGGERERQQLEAILMFVREGGKFFRIFFMIIY
jgi:hypothetical protein